eukprot:1373636-Amorphochlora_amoeboformis.AAC.1
MESKERKGMQQVGDGRDWRARRSVRVALRDRGTIFRIQDPQRSTLYPMQIHTFLRPFPMEPGRRRRKAAILTN